MCSRTMVPRIYSSAWAPTDLPRPRIRYIYLALSATHALVQWNCFLVSHCPSPTSSPYYLPVVGSRSTFKVKTLKDPLRFHRYCLLRCFPSLDAGTRGVTGVDRLARSLCNGVRVAPEVSPESAIGSSLVSSAARTPSLPLPFLSRSKIPSLTSRFKTLDQGSRPMMDKIVQW